MSLLNSLFNRGLLGSKCKTGLKLTISRIKLLRNKREVQLKQMRKEIAQFLQTGQEAIARIRVEHVIRETNILGAYEILELFCEFVLVRVPIIETQKECPWELQEAIASIIFAAPRCSDLPELMHIHNLFTLKYGKEFALSASELRPESNIIEKLSVRAPSAETKLEIFLEIAKEYNIEWDPSITEQELCRKHEDLLDGSRHACPTSENLQSPSTISRDVQGAQGSAAKENPPSENLEGGTKHQAVNKVQSPAGLTKEGSGSTSIHAVPITAPKHQIANRVQSSSSSKGSLESTPIQAELRTKSESSDVFEIARAAIASAERAAAAARAAANLAGVNLSPKPGNGILSPSGLEETASSVR